MPSKVKVRISHQIISRNSGIDVPTESELKTGETVGAFISRMAGESPDVWVSIWDQDNNCMRHNILPLVNNVSVDRTKLFSIALHDGDKLTINRILSGG